MIEVVLILIGLIWIFFASVQDIKTREVANWLNFSLIVYVLGIRFFYSLFELNNLMFFYQGLIGLLIFLILGNIFYHGRLFGGGDAKLMIALGVVLPLDVVFRSNLNIFIWFLVLFLFVGSIYGVIWSVALMVINFKKFRLEFFKLFLKNRKLILIVELCAILVLLLGFLDILFFVVGIMILVLPYFYLYARAVDNSCMISKMSVDKLREGDLLYKDIKVGKGVVRSNWEGITRSEIVKISKFKKFVFIRGGIPFVPVFLISYLGIIYFYFNGFLFNFLF